MVTNPYPDAKQPDALQDGLDFQEYVKGRLEENGIAIDYYETRDEQYNIGESKQGIEVKLDARCTETGRLSIEIAEKTRANNKEWIPSGIYRRDNSRYYIQGNRIIFFVFGKARLVELHQEYQQTEEEKRGTIKTFYLPLARAMREALRVVRKDNKQ